MEVLSVAGVCKLSLGSSSPRGSGAFRGHNSLKLQIAARGSSPCPGLSSRGRGVVHSSALLNSQEYKKQKEGESGGNESESDDEDLCPIECVREIGTLRELEHALEHAKSEGALVVVDFFRTSCGSCRYIEKGFQKLCKGAGNGDVHVVFLKHNVFDEYEEQSDIADKFRIKVVPLFHFYKNGELVESFPTRDKARILETIYKHLDVKDTIEEWSDLHGFR